VFILQDFLDKLCDQNNMLSVFAESLKCFLTNREYSKFKNICLSFLDFKLTMTSNAEIEQLIVLCVGFLSAYYVFLIMTS
jgi:hypothetical protein